MSKPAIMQAGDAISAPLGNCYITINGQRKLFMQAIEIKITAEKNKSEVPIMGSAVKGNKSTSLKYTGSATFHYNTSMFDNPMLEFQNTGKDFYFDMQLTNEDPTSTVGRRTVIAQGCNLDEWTVATINADGDYSTGEISFTVESIEIPEQYAELEGM